MNMGTSSSAHSSHLRAIKILLENDASGTDPFLITEANVPDSLRTVKLLVNAKELRKQVLYFSF